MTTLAACSNCRRHFRSNEARCPFCAAIAVATAPPMPGLLGERRSRAALLAIAVGSVTVVGCTPPSPTPDSPKPPPPAIAPDPKPDPVTNPSASVSAQAPASAALATPAIAQSPPAAAYGAPPPPTPVQSAPVEAVPGPDVKIRGVSIVGGSLPNAERVVSAMQPGFRSCYARGLKERPDAEGDVIVKIRVGSAGQILGVNVQQTTKVPATVASCMATRAAASQFDVPPGGKGVEVVAPTTLGKP